MPATPVVRPRRKRSQWKPAGLRRGNSVPCAMRDETVYFVSFLNLKPIVRGESSTLTIMIEIKQNCKQDCKRYRDEYIPNINIPKLNKPASISSREESRTCRQPLEFNGLHTAEMHEAGEKDDGKRGAVVFKEHAHRVSEERALPQLATRICNHENEQGHHDGQVERRVIAETLEHLDALLQVDERDVEAEDIARKSRHVT